MAPPLPPAAPPAPPRAGGRWALAAAVALGVVALHLLVLRSLTGADGETRAPSAPSAVRARTIVATKQVAPPKQVAPRNVVAEAPRPVSPRLDSPRPTVAVETSDTPPSAPPPTVAGTPEPAAEVTTGSGPATPGASDPLAAAAPPPDAGTETVPTYATQLPPPARLDYVLRRGLLAGSGRLTWAPDDNGGYEVTLEGGAFGQALLAQRSSGRIDAHGLAPDRFTDRRRGRTEQAANFQRAAGTITYSGPTTAFPLTPGAQDRASWMVQLGAILAAGPSLALPGGEVRLFVTGARGDADVWIFVVQGRAAVDTPAGPVTDALHVLRMPRRPFDTQAEAWLDPARGHLPVRVRLATPDSGDVTELLLAPP